MVRLAAIHLTGDAIPWYQWMKKTIGEVMWRQFVRALCVRFRPAESEDPSGMLSKLCQTSIVREYQSQFEKLANRTQQLPELFLIGCFISGLRDDIQVGVKISQPTSLIQAFHFASLYEESVTIQRRSNRPNMSRPTNVTTPFPSKEGVPIVKRLTPAEAEEHRKKGLCYNCDELLSPVQKCKGQLAIIEGVELENYELDDTMDEDNEQTDAGHVSVHALFGSHGSKTMRIKGFAKCQPVTILIDLGSTHDFISLDLAKVLDYRICRDVQLEVMVSNGGMIKSKGMCLGVPLIMQDYDCLVDCHVLQLGGCDVVLGTRCLKHLLNQKIVTPAQQKCLTKLLGYDYDIVYLKGSENSAADALSRRFEQGTIMALSTTTWDVMQDVTSSYEIDPSIQDLILRVTNHGDSVPHYTFLNGILQYKGHLVLGSLAVIRNKDSAMEKFIKRQLGLEIFDFATFRVLIYPVLELDWLHQGEANLMGSRRREHFHLMDTKAPGKKVSQELARESLIAISQSLPEKVLDSKLSFEDLNSLDVVEVIDSHGAEKYRSKLISISYAESPDIKSKTFTSFVGKV
ncbi:hypothetical protein HHK36_028541 [Tetracentron sinense]|uniref:Retrotransposon gag domain-containing protein n=1 Tax=Tetracentron sinense TaxID=13715 RepID=A0A834YFY2_TETSI|nr:hypothetical protein HHK36_028541 [Tetracentron sinense]